MTLRDPRPGAHNHIEGVPKASLDYVREMGEDTPSSPEMVGLAFRTISRGEARRSGTEIPEKQWYEVTIIGHILATSPEHAGAIALTTHKGIGLGGRASWGLRSVTGPCSVEGRNA